MVGHVVMTLTHDLALDSALVMQALKPRLERCVVVVLILTD